jgi:hypothetical protein
MQTLPLSSLDFASGVYGINPLPPPLAQDESGISIEEEVRQHGQFFDQLLTLIPPQFYLKDEEAAQEQWKTRFWRVSGLMSSRMAVLACYRCPRAEQERVRPQAGDQRAVQGCTQGTVRFRVSKDSAWPDCGEEPGSSGPEAAS